MDFPFPVSCIYCNEKQLKCKASSHSKGSCHHCLLNGIECFFPVAAVVASATVSPGVGVYVLSVLAASDPLLDFGEKGGRKVI